MLEELNAAAKRTADLELDLEDQKRSRATYQGKSITLQKELQVLDQKLVSLQTDRVKGGFKL